MCLCVREREIERERENDFDNVDAAAYVVADANVDAIDVTDFAIIDVVASVDADLADYLVIIAASCTTPSKALKQYSRPQGPYHVVRRSAWMHCPSSSSNSYFLLDSAEVKPVRAIR